MKTIEELAVAYANKEYGVVNHAYWDLTKDDVEKAFWNGMEAAQRWIPVKLELPSVSPYLGKDIKSGKVELFHVRDESFIRAIDITHWRPIEYKLMEEEK